MKIVTAVAAESEDYRGATAKLLLLASVLIVGTNASVFAGRLPNITAGLHITQGMVSYRSNLFGDRRACGVNCPRPDATCH